MEASKMSDQSNSNQSQSSEHGKEYRKHDVWNPTSEHAQGGVTSSQVSPVWAVESKAISVRKVEDKESEAVEEQQQGSQESGEESHKEPTGGWEEKWGKVYKWWV